MEEYGRTRWHQKSGVPDPLISESTVDYAYVQFFFILLMSANKKKQRTNILFLDKIFKSKEKFSEMLTIAKLVMLAQKFLRELIEYTARFPIAKPPIF